MLAYFWLSVVVVCSAALLALWVHDRFKKQEKEEQRGRTPSR